VAVVLAGGNRGVILRGKVYTSACTECHKVEDIASRNPGHEMNHAAHLAHNVECFQCHVDLAHGTLLGEPRTPVMEVCMSCHRQQQGQISKCVLCHPRNMIDNLFLRARPLRPPA